GRPQLSHPRRCPGCAQEVSEDFQNIRIQSRRKFLVGAGCRGPAQMLDCSRRVTKRRGPCSTFQTEAEFLIRPDEPFRCGDRTARWNGRSSISEDAAPLLKKLSNA